jgi:hypothetical protein
MIKCLKLRRLCKISVKGTYMARSSKYQDV